MSSIQLKNASSSLYDGFTILNQCVDSLSKTRIPNIRTSISNLNPQSTMYDLQKQALDSLVVKSQAELNNISNILSSSSQALKEASNGVHSLKGQIRQMKAEHEWAMAGSFKRIYLVGARTLSGVAELVISPYTFVKENPGALVAGGFVLAAGAGFGAGYMAAAK